MTGIQETIFCGPENTQFHQWITGNYMRVFWAGLCVIVPITVLSVISRQDQFIRLNVNLVQLHVKVTDGRGHAVAGLGKSAFRLFVDDVPQEVTVFQDEDAPVSAGIVVDNSASMAPKQADVTAAALAFARASNPKDEMFVAHFNHMVRFTLPPGMRYTGDIPTLEKAIGAFEFGGTTAFYDALVAGEEHLQSAAYSRKVLLTITDGGDNSSRASLADVLNRALRESIVIYPIGIFDRNDRDRNPSVLRSLAEQTGGEAYFPEQVSDTETACVTIARDIREQYTIGFPGAEDGAYHRIRLTVTEPGRGDLKVQTRTGYRAIQSNDR